MQRDPNLTLKNSSQSAEQVAKHWPKNEKDDTIENRRTIHLLRLRWVRGKAMRLERGGVAKKGRREDGESNKTLKEGSANRETG